jgi:hypothetical protein
MIIIVHRKLATYLDPGFSMEYEENQGRGR